MGAFVADGYVPHVQEQVNSRFALGDALTEMIGFQTEFKLFSPPHTLRSAMTLLNIAPVGEKDREGFLKYVNSLKKSEGRRQWKAVEPERPRSDPLLAQGKPRRPTAFAGLFRLPLGESLPKASFTSR
jgi:hypothetical protein